MRRSVERALYSRATGIDATPGKKESRQLNFEVVHALAQKERALISRRTTEALAAAKARGAALGNPRIGEAREKAVAEIVDRADRRAANVIPIVRQILKRAR